MSSDDGQREGLRERKRRETLHRIAESGLKLFDENGYDATTLEDVAAAAAISARTLYYYFKSKDEVLQFWIRGDFLETVAKTLLRESPDQAALAAVHRCLATLIPQFDNDRSVIVDRILNSTEDLRVRKQAFFIEVEETLCATLFEIWPAPDQRSRLRSVAMVATGALRLSLEERRRAGGARALVNHFDDQIAILNAGYAQRTSGG